MLFHPKLAITLLMVVLLEMNAGNQSSTAASEPARGKSVAQALYKPSCVSTRAAPGPRRRLGRAAKFHGVVRRVLVNGKEAKAVTPNFAQWEIVLGTEARTVEAFAEDAAGNIEKRAHAVVIK